MSNNYEISCVIDEHIAEMETTGHLFDILTSMYFDKTAPDIDNPKDEMRIRDLVLSYEQIQALIYILEERNIALIKKLTELSEQVYSQKKEPSEDGQQQKTDKKLD